MEPGSGTESSTDSDGNGREKGMTAEEYRNYLETDFDDVDEGIEGHPKED